MKTPHILLLFLLLSAVTMCQPGKTYVREDEIETPDGTKVYVVVLEGRKGVVDANDSIIVPIDFEYIHDMYNVGLVGVTKDNIEGMYSYDGKQLFPVRFEGFYNPYEDKTLIKAVDSVNETLYRIDADNNWDKLITHDKNIYRLNWVTQPYFTSVNPGETLFCLLNIEESTHEKMYLLDSLGNWTDVTSDSRLIAAREEYFNGTAVKAPADK